ncbi:uncharacterized protein Bfra_003195 [Botrytis fragariae]|uniref:Uncharacterized protein n=1 Tax=Botrytis fragariae TaxID=1964551 RepID=A0A8H6AZR9_9HELO|nr:uncharacterized protein Bfra_003195 [Botrytis fragariae]KAF5876788.1 hypothetical protein Bfra_003195 [Botrytis fragariae]
MSLFLYEASLIIWGGSMIYFDTVLEAMLLTLTVLEHLISFKSLGEDFEEMMYCSIEFNGWRPQFVVGYKHASFQLRLARELEEEYKYREFEQRLARVFTRLGGKMDCDFIEAWIDQDFQVTDDMYWRKVQAGLEPSVAEDIEDKSLKPYFELLRLRDLRLTALENLEYHGTIME